MKEFLICKSILLLYNLKIDLAETKNVATENPDVMKQIEIYLVTARTEERKFSADKNKVSVKDYVR